jgi:hypothetical protein
VSASLGGAFTFNKMSKKLIGMGRLLKKQYINKAD